MGSIYVRLHNGRQIDTSVPSGLYVNPNFWDSKQECVKLSSQCNEKERIRINKELWKLKSFLEEKAREDKDSGDRLIKGMAEKSSSRALYDLQSMGVDVILKTRVLDYKNGVVQLNDGREIPAKTVVWVSGIKANTIEGLTPESQGHANRIVTDRYCEVKGMENIYAIGDCSIMEGDPEYPMGHPQLAQVALQQADLVSKNIRLLEKGEQPNMFRYKNLGCMATIGRRKAVVEIGKFKFGGFFAWILWLVVHIRSILGVKNKASVFANWMWNYVNYTQSLRLILKIEK